LVWLGSLTPEEFANSPGLGEASYTGLPTLAFGGSTFFRIVGLRSPAPEEFANSTGLSEASYTGRRLEGGASARSVCSYTYQSKAG
jgi:hypothetical protein